MANRIYDYFKRRSYNNIYANEQCCDEPMTIDGSVNKSIASISYLILGGAFSWMAYANNYLKEVAVLTIISSIALVVSFIGILFVRKKLNILVPIFSISEGILLGATSCQFNQVYHGIVPIAILSTIVVLATMLFLYKARIIRCTQKFRTVVFTATISIALFAVVQFIALLLGYGLSPVYTSSPVGAGFSVFVIVFAALNFIFDFEFIERGSTNMFPKEYEWLAAFGIMTTIVWLYVEILRLFAKLADRR